MEIISVLSVFVNNVKAIHENSKRMIRTRRNKSGSGNTSIRDEPRRKAERASGTSFSAFYDETGTSPRARRTERRRQPRAASAPGSGGASVPPGAYRSNKGKARLRSLRRTEQSSAKSASRAPVRSLAYWDFTARGLSCSEAARQSAQRRARPHMG